MQMSSRYKDTAEFRHKVISDLKKPFDEEEYQTLWRDVQHNSLKERHLELRHGRERPVITQDKGKSYLDHYPGCSTSPSYGTNLTSKSKEMIKML